MARLRPRRRRRVRRPWIIGLTGSLAMGKSTAAAMLRRLGLPVFDADAAVHRITRPNAPALAEIAAAFPGIVTDGKLDRRALGARVFGDPAALKKLERILHPRVGRARRLWLARCSRERRPIVVIDVPLLFETAGERACNAVWTVSAPAFLQRRRALQRPGMTAEKLRGALARQTPDADKRRMADMVLPSGIGRAATLRRIVKALKILRRQKG